MTESRRIFVSDSVDNASLLDILCALNKIEETLGGIAIAIDGVAQAIGSLKDE
jgi:hypothetical protein